jgi:cytochrome d ubiquinol oxidase subunit II
MITYSFLQQYWWFIISLLGAILVFLMFVQGGQSLLNKVSQTAEERTMLVNVLGRKWELTFTTLVVFGGSLFAAFPLFYSTSFGGAYWLWMLILFCFIIQAVAYEFRSKPSNIYGAKVYEAFLFINGTFGTFLLGVALGGLFEPSNFSVNELNQSKWQSPFHGLETIFYLKNALLGFSVLFLSRLLGLFYFINNVNDENIATRSRKYILQNFIPFIIFFIAFLLILFISEGYSYNPDNNFVFVVPYKYFNNIIGMPALLVLFISGVMLVVLAIILSAINKRFNKAFWIFGLGVFLTVLVLFLISGYNNTAIYPSRYNIQHSLTIQNSCSSEYTLAVMAIVSLFIPIVAIYIAIVWKSMNKKRIDKQELKDEFHVY